MSGVEIAGFVLAALPLMISGLEHYRESAEVLETWWKIKREYQKCMRNLKYHKVAFEENLEELLLPLIADEVKLHRLLNDPGGSEWKDPKLEALLQQRMPKTYSSYMDTMESMLETIKGLEESLGTDKTHFQSHVSIEGEHVEASTNGQMSIMAHVTSNIEYHSQRIRLAFNKDVRKQLFDDFGDQNLRLRDILGSSDRLAGLRRARVSTAVNSALWKFWSHGNAVFNLLTEAWSCKCQAFHHANLLLQHRVVPTVNFRVVFWFKAHLAGALSAQVPWAWQDTRIKLLQETSMPTVISIPVPINTKSPIPIVKQALTQSKTPQQAIEPPISSSKPTKKFFSMDKFRYSKNSPTSSTAKSIAKHGVMPTATSCSIPTATPNQKSTTTKTKVAFADPTPVQDEDPQTPKIINLCSKIAECSSDLSRYGYLEGEARQYLVEPICCMNKKPQKYITLETLLSKSSQIHLTRRQRFLIALILASSHVQLHPTPWLKSKWTKKDILFLYDPQDPTKIGTDQPFISRSLSKSLQQITTSTQTSDSIYTFQDSIRNLGIMLLELCFGTAIEDHRVRPKVDVDDEQILNLINYAAADHWARDVVEEAGPEYSDAVNWCLHHTPERSGLDGMDEKWRENMFAKVVEPLKACHDQLVK
ncbi:hypothetical protein NA56DRAFT_693937 [Hyaloscypha hepaticicola]|uniref:DUF7580 domain-containing protein n=1 Tax=Hyaloscypha hepaticicola TaxID=2082293 RepID=A0A2J6PKI8_9HELO|nr:hypothetical protein NA56DRAFT_693937 [Hyaloscypha hepaticicola]